MDRDPRFYLVLFSVCAGVFVLVNEAFVLPFQFVEGYLSIESAVADPVRPWLNLVSVLANWLLLWGILQSGVNLYKFTVIDPDGSLIELSRDDGIPERDPVIVPSVDVRD